MRRTWTWHFDLPPDRLWPVLADTNRFNEAMGLPPYVLEETPQPNGTVLRRGQGKAAGFTLEWEEKPYEWILDRHFRQARVFTKGPFRRFGPVFDIEPDGRRQQGELRARMGAAHLGRPAVRQRGWREQAGDVVEKRMLQAVAFAKGERADHVRPAAARAAGRRARARGGARRPRSTAAPTATGSASGSADHVLTGMASDLAHLKPKLLARELGVAQRAGDRGLPRRRARGPADDEMGPAVHQLPRRPSSAPRALAELPRGAHCPSCNIDYDRDFERNVELAFSPAPAIRPLMAGGYCLSGPMATPHVPVQLLLAPGERRSVELDLPPGRYRLRTLHPGTAADVEHDGGAFPGLRVDGDRRRGDGRRARRARSPSPTTRASSSPR